MSPEDLPRYTDLILPAIRAVEALGGSAKAREIVDQLIDTLPNSEELSRVK